MKKVSVSVLSSVLALLTACGGSGSNLPASSLPTSTKPTSDNSKKTAKSDSKKTDKTDAKLEEIQVVKPEDPQKTENIISENESTENTYQDILSIKSNNLISIISTVEKRIKHEIDTSDYDVIKSAYNSAISDSFTVSILEPSENISDNEKKYNILSMTSDMFLKGETILKNFEKILKEQGKSYLAKEVLIQFVKAFNLTDIIDVKSGVTVADIASAVTKNYTQIKNTINSVINTDFKRQTVDFSKYDFNGSDLSFIFDDNNNISKIRFTRNLDENFAKNYDASNSDRTSYKSLITQDISLSDFYSSNKGLMIAKNSQKYKVPYAVYLVKNNSVLGLYSVPALSSSGGYFEYAEDSQFYPVNDMLNTWSKLIDEGYSGSLISDLKNGVYGADGKNSVTNVKTITQTNITNAFSNHTVVDIGNNLKLLFERYHYIDIDTELALAGKSVDLSYSQFGNIKTKTTISSSDLSNYPNNTSFGSFSKSESEGFAFIAGNSDYKIDISNINNYTSFTGKTFGTITYEDKTTGIKNYKDISGNVSLTLNPSVDERENLFADFDNYYRVTVVKNKNGSSNLVLDDTNVSKFYQDNNLVFDTKTEGIVLPYLIDSSFQYYGNAGSVEEAVGYVNIGGNLSKNREMYLRLSFGAKKE